MSGELSLDLDLTESQEACVFAEEKYPAFVGGYGSGKSQTLVVRSLLQKFRYPKLNQGYFAPTYDLIALIAVPRFQALLETWNIGYRYLKNEKRLYLKTGGSIIFRTLDKPARIVGFEIADAVVDELDTLPKAHAEDAWNKVIGRCRQVKPDGKPNTACVGTTPEGFRFVHDRWQKKATENYRIYRGRTRDNPFLADDYIDGLRETYPAHLLDAYLEGKFINMASGSVYPDFDRERNGTRELLHDNEPLHIGMDFNVHNMSAVVFAIRNERPMALDELSGVRDTPAMVKLINERFSKNGRSIIVYPDASGDSRKSVNAQTSDLAIIREGNLQISVNSSNPAVRDRVNAVNAQIMNGSGTRHLLVNPQKCPRFTASLEEQAYDANGEPDKKKGFDHHADAGGYFIAKKFPIVRPNAVVTPLRM